MQKEKKTQKQTNRPPETAPIPVRPRVGSPIHKLLDAIREVNPGLSENDIINEALSRFLPDLLNEEKEKLVKRVEELTGKKLK